MYETFEISLMCVMADIQPYVRTGTFTSPISISAGDPLTVTCNIRNHDGVSMNSVQYNLDNDFTA